MSGLIVPVGAWVLEEACRHGAAWLREGHQIAVSVNVSSKQLMLDRFIDDVKLALVVSGFDPNLLILELNGKRVLLQNDERAITNLTLLKTLGVRIAIDDFWHWLLLAGGISQTTSSRHFEDRSFIRVEDC